ncbi:glycosyltransferase family 4 protein [Pseudactinotalea sp. Z1732]|uniref:glycosyltransferase family 4 protein n=1 Tax=Micrococcales TaxID=85006 RepID=UPI003C7C5E23
MRIVHISDCFAPRLGGIENQVQDLGIQQARAGHAVHVLTATAQHRAAVPPGRSRHRFSSTEDGGLRVHRLATPATFGVPVHPRGRALITRALRLLKPDVVHVHAGVVSPFAYAGAMAARDVGLPLAITWHCVLSGARHLLGWGARATQWDTAAFAPSAVSGLVAGQVAQALGRSDVQVVPNGLDLAPWRGVAVRPEPGAEPGVLRVVASQRMASRKRTVPLIRVIAQVHERLGRTERDTPRIHLTLAGDGPGMAAVRSRVAAAELDDVITLLGRVPRDVLPTLYRAQDVFVSPTSLEAFGLAALEARAAGLAVVGMRDSGIAEFITDGVEGLLVRGDAGMADALVRLAREPGLLRTITTNNRAEPPALGWPDVLERVDGLYQRARALPRSTETGRRR